MVHGRRARVRTLRALHELTLRAIPLLLLGVAAGASAQDWSGASLRGAQQLALPEGYRAEVLARGLRLPQDLAVDPSDGLWVLCRGARGRSGAGTLVRVPLNALGPIDATQLPAVLIPFGSTTVPFEVGSVARHPGSGDLYVSEGRGHHVYRVTTDGRVTVFATGGRALVDGRALVFDNQGQLLVLDLAGSGPIAEMTMDPLRELLETGEPYQGPVVYRLRVDEVLPLPRNLEYARSAFPPAALRRRTVVLPRYHSLASLPSGELVGGAHGVIDRLRPDGTIVRLAELTGVGAVVAGNAGVLYALDYLGGRIARVHPNGAVESFAEGLVRPAALAVLGDGTLAVAEDTGRLLRIFLPPVTPR